MRIGLWQHHALEPPFGVLDEDAIDTAPAALTGHLIGVNVGALCRLTVDLELLKTLLYKLPVFPVEILEDAGADQQQTFCYAMDAGTG